MKKTAIALVALIAFGACSEDQQQATPVPATPTPVAGGPASSPNVVITTPNPGGSTPTVAVATPTVTASPVPGSTATPNATAVPGSTATPAATNVPQTGCTDLRGTEFARIAMVDNAFQPACVIIDLDQKFEFANHGTVFHNFSVNGTKIDIDVAPNSVVYTDTIRGAIPVGRRGMYDKRYSGMTGTLDIRD